MRNRFDYYFEDASTAGAIALAILITILSLGIAFGISCLWGWIFMLVWNNLLPLLWVEAPTIGFWLATGIVFVIRLLLKLVVNVNNKN